MAYSAQQVFDKAVAHVLTQGVPAGYHPPDNKGFTCKYRHADVGGDRMLMCAAGVLIPDELYSPTFERKSLRQVTDTCTPVFHLFDNQIAIRVAERLQDSHDQSAYDAARVGESFISGFRMRARAVAGDFSLDQSVLNEGVAQ